MDVVGLTLRGRPSLARGHLVRGAAFFAEETAKICHRPRKCTRELCCLFLSTGPKDRPSFCVFKQGVLEWAERMKAVVQNGHFLSVEEEQRSQ